MGQLRKLIRQELHEAGITTGFQSAVEKFRDETIKLQQLRVEQDQLVDRFKKSDPKTKQRLKKDLIAMHKKVQKQQKDTDAAERKFNKALIDEPEDLELDESINESKIDPTTDYKFDNIKVYLKDDHNNLNFKEQRRAYDVIEGSGGIIYVNGEMDNNFYNDVNYVKAFELLQTAKSDRKRKIHEFGRQSAEFVAVEDGKIIRSFPGYREASQWFKNNQTSGVSIKSKKDHEASKGMHESIKLKDTGKKDSWGRPIYKDSKGKIYKDIELGRGKDGPDIHTTTKSGEPNSRVKDFVVESRLNENFSKRDLSAIESIMQDVDGRLVNIREPLKQSGFTNVDFSFQPVPHFTIRKGRKRLVILNKKYVDDAKIEVGNLAAGIMESTYKEELPSDCASCDEMNESDNNRMDQFRDIVKSKSIGRVDGIDVDTTTANSVLQVYNKLDKSAQRKLDNLPTNKLIDVVWKIIRV